MNKKLKIYFEGLGLNVEGNNAYGNLKGYEVSANVAMLDKISPVKLHVNLYASDETKVAIVNEIKNLKYKYFVVEADLYGILLGFNDPLTVGKLLKRMPEMLEQIFAIFEKYEACGVGYCPICGQTLKEESKQYQIGWALITMDAECVNDLNEIVEAENKEFDESPNNYLKGTLGAAIGALVGAVAFIILFYLGYVSAITSFIAILLGTYLYKKLGGKPNNVMVAIVSIISIVSMALTCFGIYLTASQALVSEFGFSSTGLQAFKDMMTIEIFSEEFTTNLLMTLFFSILGVAFEIGRLAKSVKRQTKIK